MIPILSVVGKKGCGKTTVLEKVIAGLGQHDIRVGTIKHDAHDFEIDHEGKDTYRHFHAGATQVMITTSHKLALIKRTSHTQDLDEIVQTYFTDVDIVITEGYKSRDKPKIEVFRSTVHASPLCDSLDNLIAFVTDMPIEQQVVQFRFDEIDPLVDFIINTFLAGSVTKV